MTPSQRTRLIKLLGMLGSEHDGECLNAARSAQRLVKEAGETWEQVLMAATGVDPQEVANAAFKAGYADGRAYRPPTWRALAEDLLDEDINDWETEFCEGFIARGWASPSEKQRAVFERMADKFGLNTP
jgi:hypothetical protein